MATRRRARRRLHGLHVDTCARSARTWRTSAASWTAVGSVVCARSMGVRLHLLLLTSRARARDGLTRPRTHMLVRRSLVEHTPRRSVLEHIIDVLQGSCLFSRLPHLSFLLGQMRSGIGDWGQYSRSCPNPPKLPARRWGVLGFRGGAHPLELPLHCFQKRRRSSLSHWSCSADDAADA